MARITAQDCLKVVPNRFDLVLLTAKRARQLEMQNAEPKVDIGDNKSIVAALREIAAGYTHFPEYKPVSLATPFQRQDTRDLSLNEDI